MQKYSAKARNQKDYQDLSTVINYHHQQHQNLEPLTYFYVLSQNLKGSIIRVV